MAAQAAHHDKADEAKKDTAETRYITETAIQMSARTSQEVTHQESESIR